MLHYRLNRQAERPKGSRVVLPPIADAAGDVQDYLKALRQMLRGIATEVRVSVIPYVEREIARKRAAPALQIDADPPSLAAIANRLVEVAMSMVDRVLDLAAKRHTKRFIEAAKKALGIDVGAVVRDEDLTDYIAIAAGRNASLIRSLAADIVKRVEQATLQNLVANGSVAELRKKLTAEFGVVDSRAKVIARDQVAKINSDLNRIRHQQAGVTEYEWMTSHDERVRPLHRTLDGKVYAYGEPTGAENGLPPGQPIMCRCIARGIVQF